MKDEYYKPSEVSAYRKEHVIWLLKNVLFQDTWPSDHRTETGYSGSKGNSRGHNAPFTTIREVIGELNARLKSCGPAGLYLEYLTIVDYGDQDYLLSRLAGYHDTTPREVSYLAKMAMRYCCGRKRKHVTFDKFCSYTKSRDNARQQKRGERTIPSPNSLTMV